MINYHKTALENTFEARTIIKDFLSISVIILDSFFPDKISSSDKTAWYQDFLDQFLLKHDLSGKRTYILGSLSSRVLEIKFTELLLRHHFSLSCVCLRFNLSAVHSQYVLVAYPAGTAVTYPEHKRLVFSLGCVVVNRF